MVFRLPPMPKPGTVNQSVVKRAKKSVDETMREANRRGVASAPKTLSHVPESSAVKWPGHVVDPAWLKANPTVTKPKMPVPDWREMLCNLMEKHLAERFDPRQLSPDVNKPLVAMWEPLTHDFVEALAYIIERIMSEPEFRSKLMVKAGGTVNPHEIIGQHEFRDAIKPELKTLLERIQQAIRDGISDFNEALCGEHDTMIIRSVWENDIVDDSTASDIRGEEITEACEEMDDMAFEQEAARRGYRIERL